LKRRVGRRPAARESPGDREVIYGRRPVLELLRAGRRRVYQLRIAQGLEGGASLEEVYQAASQSGVRVESVPRQALDDVPGRHGGVAAVAGPYPWAELEDVVGRIRASDRPCLVLVLDVIQDPQNLGSLLRTAEAVGVDGVLLPLRRGAEITPAVVSASAGATEHLAIVQANLAQALAQLKEGGVWIVGLDSNPALPDLRSVDLALPLALVVGNEAEGMRRLVRDSCDWVVRLPAQGAVESLNAAVAGSIALYAAWEARRPGPAAAGTPELTATKKVDRI